MAPLLLESLKGSAPRPRTEFYGDVSAALQREFHPPDAVTSATPAAASDVHQRDAERGRAALMATLAPAARTAAPARRRHLSDRAKAERRLGVLLSAPAMLVLLGVAGYPILQAAYQSLFSYRLTAPDAREFVGLHNYAMILSDSVWWTDFGTTLLITVVTVAVELVLGFAFALVMHRLVFGRGIVRTAILVPYAIITVVSAYAWQYAFATDSGFVNTLVRPLARLVRRAELGALRRLPVGDLEDDAVHRAACCSPGWLRSRAAEPGGDGRRRHLVAALLVA